MFKCLWLIHTNDNKASQLQCLLNWQHISSAIPVNSTSPPSRMAFSSVISTMFRSSFFRVSFINSVCKETTKHRGTCSLQISVELKIHFQVLSINLHRKELVWTCAAEGHLRGRMLRWECQSRAKRRFRWAVKRTWTSTPQSPWRSLQ